jgi:hypothetical protein
MSYNSEVCDFWAKQKYTCPIIFQVVSIPIVRIWKFALSFSMRIYSIFAQAYLKRMTWFLEKVGWNSRYILRKFHQKSLMAWLWKLIKTFVFSFENDCSRVFNFRSFHLSIFSTRPESINSLKSYSTSKIPTFSICDSLVVYFISLNNVLVD